MVNTTVMATLMAALAAVVMELVVVEFVMAMAVVMATALVMTRAIAMASGAHSPAVRHCAVADEQRLRVSQTRRAPLGAVQMVMIRCPEIQAQLTFSAVAAVLVAVSVASVFGCQD